MTCNDNGTEGDSKVQKYELRVSLFHYVGWRLEWSVSGTELYRSDLRPYYAILHRKPGQNYF